MNEKRCKFSFGIFERATREPVLTLSRDHQKARALLPHMCALRNAHGSALIKQRRATALQILPSRCGKSWIGNIRNYSGFQTFVNDRSVALSPAHQKQGPFPPPTLLGLHGCMTLSDFRAGHHPIDDVEGAISTTPGYPAITQITFLACCAHYPGGSNRCACRFLPCPCCLPRLTGGSASTTSLLRPAQASLALRPARLLARL